MVTYPSPSLAPYSRDKARKIGSEARNERIDSDMIPIFGGCWVFLS
jgi:hypothetical protein